jgi:uncharacterized protein (DUF924 family)
MSMSPKTSNEVPPDAAAVLAFWRDAGPRTWFAKDAAFDKAFTDRFMPLHFAVAAREHDAWLDNAHAGLALVLMLDQFPRNAFRGTAHMYATDPLGRYYARAMLDAGHIKHIEDELKLFVCVPFIHSEDLHDQMYALQLYRKYAAHSMEWALDHHDIIKRFGRFPHRNTQLGRLSTTEERHFLESGGFAG